MNEFFCDLAFVNSSNKIYYLNEQRSLKPCAQNTQRCPHLTCAPHCAANPSLPPPTHPTLRLLNNRQGRHPRGRNRRRQKHSDHQTNGNFFLFKSSLHDSKIQKLSRTLSALVADPVVSIFVRWGTFATQRPEMKPLHYLKNPRIQ